MKVSNDGFIWKIVHSQDKTEDIYDSNCFDLYILYDDDSEALITTRSEIQTAFDANLPIGIQVGKSKQSYVYYLPYDNKRNVTHAIDTNEFEDDIINSSNVEIYSLKDFQSAFNSECISDLTYMVISNKKPKVLEEK